MNANEQQKNENERNKNWGNGHTFSILLVSSDKVNSGLVDENFAFRFFFYFSSPSLPEASI